MAKTFGDAFSVGFQNGAAAWPGVAVHQAAFERFVSDRFPSALPEGGRWGDLYIAYGCSTGDTAALAAFDAAMIPEVRAGLSRLRLDASAVDDTIQILRRDLFTGETPRILTYGGQGDLFGWAKVVATRIALKLGRKTRREVSSEEAIALDAASEGDPEMLLMRAHYKAAFQTAVSAAIASLDPKEALLIKQNTVDGLSIDELGTLHGVHRATVARWLQKARETLVDRIRQSFQAGGGLSSEECESVLRLVQSKFDVTIRRHLVRAAGGLRFDDSDT